MTQNYRYKLNLIAVPCNKENTEENIVKDLGHAQYSKKQEAIEAYNRAIENKEQAAAEIMPHWKGTIYTERIYGVILVDRNRSRTTGKRTIMNEHKF